MALSPDQFKLFHGTDVRWKGDVQASYDRPFYTSTRKNIAATYGKHVKQYGFTDDAVLHHVEGDSPAGGGESRRAEAREKGADATVYSDSVVEIYNPRRLR